MDSQINVQNLGNIVIGEKRQLEDIQLKNLKDNDLECEIIINSDWLENLSESKILFPVGSTIRISLGLNTSSLFPGNQWAEVLVWKLPDKEIIYRKLFITSFITTSSENSSPNQISRPSIKVYGEEKIDFGKVHFKVLNKKIWGKEIKHVITIINESDNQSLTCKIKKDSWIKVDNDILIIHPGKSRDINISIDIEEIEKQNLSLVEGNITIDNNSINQPNINCNIRLIQVFDYPPFPILEQGEIDFGNCKPGSYSKEFVITNSGKKPLIGYIEKIPEWLKVNSRDIHIFPEANDNLIFYLNINTTLPDKTELKDKIKVIFNAPSEIRGIDIPVKALVDRREVIINISPKEITLGNIIKSQVVKGSFEIKHNDITPVKVKITCRDKWIEFTEIICNGEKKIDFTGQKLEIEINPGENLLFNFKIDTTLCSTGIRYIGEIKIEFIDRDMPNEFVRIYFKPLDPKNFIIDFGQRPINLGKVIPGNDITQELELKYAGIDKDIVLIGQIIPLSEWIKIEEPEFTVKYGEITKIKMYGQISGEIFRRKEGNILVNFYPDKCFPVLPSIPQQIETVIVESYKEEVKIEPEKSSKSILERLSAFIKNLFFQIRKYCKIR